MDSCELTPNAGYDTRVPVLGSREIVSPLPCVAASEERQAVFTIDEELVDEFVTPR